MEVYKTMSIEILMSDEQKELFYKTAEELWKLKRAYVDNRIDYASIASGLELSEEKLGDMIDVLHSLAKYGSLAYEE